MFPFTTSDMSILTHILIGLGAFLLIKICYLMLLEIYNAFIYFCGIKQMFDLKSYGEWAVVTGSTDGIGKAFAEELARRGLNIVLVSRSEEKLRNTATEIENGYPVKTLCIQADFKNRDCYDNIKENLQDIDIAILVNNVGMALSKPKKYYNIDENDIWNGIDVNIGSTCMMTRIVLPHMVEKKKGIILNISSLATKSSLPFMGVYAATKSFMEMFSYSLFPEVKKHNIMVRCLIPGFVQTNMTNFHLKYLKKYTSMGKMFFPLPKTYVQNAIDTLSENKITTTGYWPFSIIVKPFLWLSWEKKSQLVYLFEAGFRK